MSHHFTSSRVFNKILSEALDPEVGGEGQNLRQRCNLQVRVYRKLLECISSILEQKLDCLNRTQTSLKFGFFFQWQYMNTLFKPG